MSNSNTKGNFDGKSFLPHSAIIIIFSKFISLLFQTNCNEFVVKIFRRCQLPAAKIELNLHDASNTQYALF